MILSSKMKLGAGLLDNLWLTDHKFGQTRPYNLSVPHPLASRCISHTTNRVREGINNQNLIPTEDKKIKIRLCYEHF